MSDHTSDCALHNAPAEAPGNCSCGASRLFRLFRYDISNDAFRWVVFSREALIAEVVSSALARVYGQQNEGNDRLGHLTGLSEIDGRYLNLEDVPGVLTMPDDGEIADVLAPWFEYWRTLPEPVRRLTVPA